MLGNLCVFIHLLTYLLDLPQDQFISVLIKDGHPVFRYKIGSEPPKQIERNATLNDGTYKPVSNFKQLSDHYL